MVKSSPLVLAVFAGALLGGCGDGGTDATSKVTPSADAGKAGNAASKMNGGANANGPAAATGATEVPPMPSGN